MAPFVLLVSEWRAVARRVSRRRTRDDVRRRCGEAPDRNFALLYFAAVADEGRSKIYVAHVRLNRFEY